MDYVPFCYFVSLSGRFMFLCGKFVCLCSRCEESVVILLNFLAVMRLFVLVLYPSKLQLFCVVFV